jgi:hypothetical protein
MARRAQLCEPVDASAAVLAAVAAGDITSDEAGRVMALLTAHRGLLETGEFEADRLVGSGRGEMRLVDCVGKLEAGAPTVSRVCHRLVHDIGQTRGEVLDAYGRNLIAAGDSVIVRRIVEPGERRW